MFSISVGIVNSISKTIQENKIKLGIIEINKNKESLKKIINLNKNSLISPQLILLRNKLLEKANIDSNIIWSENNYPKYDLTLVSPQKTIDNLLVAGNVSVVTNKLHRAILDKIPFTYQFQDFYYTDKNKIKLFVVASSVQVDHISYEIYLIFPYQQEINFINKIKYLILGFDFTVIILIMLLVWKLCNYFLKPIKAITKAIDIFSTSKNSMQLYESGRDDIAKMNSNFNQMVNIIDKQRANFEELHYLQKQFTSDVSHELRTPLAVIRMATDVISSSKNNLDRELVRSIEILEAEIERFEKLLIELLEISKHDAKAARLKIEKVNLLILVGNALRTVIPLALESRIQILVDVPKTVVLAEVDSRRVERILRNLLVNAIQYSDDKPIKLTMKINDRAVAISVRDKGIGLTIDETKLVFNRFWRADTARVRTSGGTGLGLAISKADAKLHGGDLLVWGKPGAGANFLLVLPLQRGKVYFSSPLSLNPDD